MQPILRITLSKKGVPFRDSHEIIGRMVSYCIKNKKSLEDMSLEEFCSFSPKIETDVYDAISLRTCVNERKVHGGPSGEEVRRAINEGRNYLETV